MPRRPLQYTTLTISILIVLYCLGVLWYTSDYKKYCTEEK